MGGRNIGTSLRRGQGVVFYWLTYIIGQKSIELSLAMFANDGLGLIET